MHKKHVSPEKDDEKSASTLANDPSNPPTASPMPQTFVAVKLWESFTRAPGDPDGP